MKRLTTHVLDTASGIPGAGITIDLYQDHGDTRHHIVTTRTNSDGRTDKPLLDEQTFSQGNWELVFHVGEYFAKRQSDLSDPPFLTRVSIRFGIGSDSHFHVPLLVSPWSYSTYRGS